MSLCMYRATCLASSVLPAQTAIKHLLGSMQLISSNNKMSQWSRESGTGDRMTTSCREKRDVFILLASCGTRVHHLSLPLFLSQGNVLYESKYRSYEF